MKYNIDEQHLEIQRLELREGVILNYLHELFVQIHGKNSEDKECEYLDEIDRHADELVADCLEDEIVVTESSSELETELESVMGDYLQLINFIRKLKKIDAEKLTTAETLSYFRKNITKG